MPGSSAGCIKWRMDFGCCGLLVDEVTMRLSCVEDYGGEIMIALMGSSGHKRVRYAAGENHKRLPCVAGGFVGDWWPAAEPQKLVAKPREEWGQGREKPSCSFFTRLQHSFLRLCRRPANSNKTASYASYEKSRPVFRADHL